MDRRISSRKELEELSAARYKATNDQISPVVLREVILARRGNCEANTSNHGPRFVTPDQWLKIRAKLPNNVSPRPKPLTVFDMTNKYCMVHGPGGSEVRDADIYYDSSPQHAGWRFYKETENHEFERIISQEEAPVGHEFDYTSVSSMELYLWDHVQ